MYSTNSGQDVHFEYRGAFTVPVVTFLLFMFGVCYWVRDIKERYMPLIYRCYVCYILTFVLVCGVVLYSTTIKTGKVL